MKSKVVYIVVGWNNKDLLKECFESIENQTHKNTITYYVDNNSADNSVEFVKENFPKVVILAQDENTGFAKGNNIAIRQAIKDDEVGFIALINSDARIDPQWTARIVEFASKKPKGAIYQGLTLDYYNHTIIDSTHIYISHNGQGTQGNWRHYVTKEMGPKKVFGVNAAACLISVDFIKTQPFDTYFDETLFMYLEDVDVATRATVMGWDNYLVPGAAAYHMGSASSNKSPGFSLYMTFRNNSSVLYKNLPNKMLMRMLPMIIRGDIDTIRELRRRKQKGGIGKVVKGRLFGLLRVPLFRNKKKIMSSVSDIDYDYLWTLMKKGY